MTRPLFAARSLATLKRAAGSPILLVFDFDGTLAPIVTHPAAARMTRTTRALLCRVAQLYPTAVLTGRDRADVARRVRGIPLAAIVGNHGLDAVGVSAKARAAVRHWRRALAPLAGTQGVVIEVKDTSISIHFRASKRRAAAKRAIHAVVGRLNPVPRIVTGKQVVNLLPDLGVHKGTATLALMRARRARAAIFVGDDVTDEDVFALPASAHVLTIRVGRAGKSAARYRIAGQSEVDRLLAALIAFRSGGGAASGGTTARSSR